MSCHGIGSPLPACIIECHEQIQSLFSGIQHVRRDQRSLNAFLSTRSMCAMQVDEHLRVIGHDRIFAVGDATDVKETKLGYLAAAQVNIANHSTLAELSTVMYGTWCVTACCSHLPAAGWPPLLLIRMSVYILSHDVPTVVLQISIEKRSPLWLS